MFKWVILLLVLTISSAQAVVIEKTTAQTPAKIPAFLLLALPATLAARGESVNCSANETRELVNQIASKEFKRQVGISPEHEIPGLRFSLADIITKKGGGKDSYSAKLHIVIPPDSKDDKVRESESTSLIALNGPTKAASTSRCTGSEEIGGRHDVLLLDCSSLSQAELYGGCLTHSQGHYEQWEGWCQLGIRRLRKLGYPTIITTTEYEAWPRGRVVYDKPKSLFITYADRRLHRQVLVGAFVAAFGISDQTWRLMSDGHYA